MCGGWYVQTSAGVCGGQSFQISGAGVTYGCDLFPVGAGYPIGLLQEQYILLIVEPSLYL